MKRKGFTLIELLAVIVILAIIALIATPIILNIISDAKEESNKRSVELYGKAVEQAIAKHQLNNNESISGTFTTTDGKTLTKGETKLKVEYNGNIKCTTTEIYEDGTVYLADCTVNGRKVNYTYGKLILKPGAYDTNDKLIADWDTLVSYGLDVEGSSSNYEVFQKEELKNVRKLVIPDSVTSIGGGAFAGCSNLTSVTIPDSVTSIGGWAFIDTGLTSIIIPDSVTSIGENAFHDCNNLTSVTIGNSVTSIEYRTFEGCSNLTSVTIGNSVASIELLAFQNCSNLTSIIIPDSVTSIGSGAFVGCSNLTSVTIGNSVTRIEDDAFRGTGLTSVTIPDSVTSIGAYAFDGCSNLTSITIPNSVTNIGDYAFAGNGIKSVTIPDGVTSIGRGAFGDWYNLTSVTIPDSVTSIEYYAFDGCTNLTRVTFNNSNGWKVVDLGNFDEETGDFVTVDSIDLSDPTTNATYLKGTYSYAYWTRN